MSYWNSAAQTIVRYSDQPWGDEYPGWEAVDCGCCAGVVWTYGSECRDCGGSGMLARHRESRVLAQYPGGPLRGVDPRLEAEVSGSSRGGGR